MNRRLMPYVTVCNLRRFRATLPTRRVAKLAPRSSEEPRAHMLSRRPSPAYCKATVVRLISARTVYSWRKVSGNESHTGVVQQQRRVWLESLILLEATTRRRRLLAEDVQTAPTERRRQCRRISSSPKECFYCLELDAYEGVRRWCCSSLCTEGPPPPPYVSEVTSCSLLPPALYALISSIDRFLYVKCTMYTSMICM